MAEPLELVIKRKERQDSLKRLVEARDAIDEWERNLGSWFALCMRVTIKSMNHKLALYYQAAGPFSQDQCEDR